MKKKSTFVIRIIASVVLVLLMIGDFAVIKSLRINDAQIRESESDGNVKKTEQLPPDFDSLMNDVPKGFRNQLEQLLENQPQDGYTPEETAAVKKFYSESAFIGDSLLVAFRLYLQKKDPKGYFAKSTMLCAYSFSTRAALKPVTEENIHPLYKGKKYPVWESVKKSGAKRVFIMFWANEIPGGNVEKANSNLEKMVQKIRNECPGIEIYIISPCYLYKNTKKKTNYLNNENLYALTLSRREFCKKNNAGYVEVSKYIGNEKDGLYEKYTSDWYVHVNDAAYDIWKQVFIDYALGREAVIETNEKSGKK